MAATLTCLPVIPPDPDPALTAAAEHFQALRLALETAGVRAVQEACPVPHLRLVRSS